MTPSAQQEGRLSRAELDEVFSAFTPADWARATTMARAAGAGVVDCAPEDLLQDAIAKLLAGSRVYPRGIPPLVVLGNVMYSIASNKRRREAKRVIDRGVRVAHCEGEDAGPVASGVVTVTPERILEQKQLLEALDALLADDEDLRLLVLVWADELRGDAAMDELRWEKNRYEAARKRLVRRLAALEQIGARHE